uniref:C1q domain-containing protein n=1 Tax=Magallana gigas TaxID=29159 RepID=A0A8W8MM89_MAGGI
MLIVAKPDQMILCQTFYIYHVQKQKITDVPIVTRRHFFGTNFLKISETLLQPYGFYAVLKSDNGPGILHFETVITNIGDGYSQHTGFFTPETNGTFVFTWNIESYNESAVIALEVNGEEIIQTHTAQKYRLHYSGSSFAILNLHQGDNVYLKLIEGITKRTFTMFSGWKQHSDLLPTFYAVCPSGGCSNDMQIITNNFVYDNISNIINLEAGFYLPMNSRNEQLEYNVPVWTHRTTDNFTNYYYHPNASGFIFLPNFDEASCNVLEHVPELEQTVPLSWQKFHNVTDGAALLAIGCSFEGQAETWLQTLSPRQRNNLTEFKECLKNRFAPQETKFTLLSIRQQAGETADMYLSRAEKTALGHDLPEIYKVQFAIQGLENQVKAKVISKEPKTFQELRHAVSLAKAQLECNTTEDMNNLTLVALAAQLKDSLKAEISALTQSNCQSKNGQPEPRNKSPNPPPPWQQFTPPPPGYSVPNKLCSATYLLSTAAPSATPGPAISSAVAPSNQQWTPSETVPESKSSVQRMW